MTKEEILNGLNNILENGLYNEDYFRRTNLRDIINQIILKYPEDKKDDENGENK